MSALPRLNQSAVPHDTSFWYMQMCWREPGRTRCGAHGDTQVSTRTRCKGRELARDEDTCGLHCSGSTERLLEFLDLFVPPVDVSRQKWLSTKKGDLHGDPRPDSGILSPWCRRLSLPIPCHVHWQRSCCQSHARPRQPYAKRLVSGDLLCACRNVCVRAVPACGVRGCCVGARREPGHRHGCGEAVPVTTGGRRTLVGSPLQRRGHMWVLYGRERGELGDVVSSSSAGSSMRGRLGCCGVR